MSGRTAGLGLAAVLLAAAGLWFAQRKPPPSRVPVAFDTFNGQDRARLRLAAISAGCVADTSSLMEHFRLEFFWCREAEPPALARAAREQRYRAVAVREAPGGSWSLASGELTVATRDAAHKHQMLERLRATSYRESLSSASVYVTYLRPPDERAVTDAELAGLSRALGAPVERQVFTVRPVAR